MSKKQKILVLHGPNLNLLGKRMPDIYGPMSLDEINNCILNYAQERRIQVDIHQTNSETMIINLIHKAQDYNGIVLNPGAYTHSSYAIRDAIEAMKIRTIEVHLSNIYAREPFRQKSVIAPVCIGQITGLGWYGYILAIAFLINSQGDKDAI